jgi:UDP-N-acetylmuramoyl-L-alanyl-D-glutamate--2,6-diaminopimelate ligase
LFVARRGERIDGTQFVEQAMKAGASAVLCEAETGVRAEPRLEVQDVRRAWGICAHALYRRPSDALTVVGITGTNGKTTVAYLVDQALTHLGVSTGRLGTLGFFLNGEKLEDSLTTPQPDQLAHCLASVRDAGGRALLMEVSSHALDQKRTAGVRFSVVAFTNLSLDHLDYHLTMEEYARAKGRLFREGDPGARVINVDDEFGRALCKEFPDAISVSTTGATAHISAVDVHLSRTGLVAQVRSGDELSELVSPLLGQHNLENLLVSWGILTALGHSPTTIVDALGQAVGVPGRLERCDDEQDDVIVVVDYAHTPDALERALKSVVALDFEEVICVFGCGGDRDKTKRPLMGRAAAELADKVFVTSDNPRTEEPMTIIEEILPGLRDARCEPIVEVDRRQAIELAVVSALPGSVVLIAGKGHEDYQLIGDQVLRFDDRVEARRALARRRLLKGN